MDPSHGSLLSVLIAGGVASLGGIVANYAGVAIRRYQARKTKDEVARKKLDDIQLDERLEERRIYIEAVNTQIADLRSELKLERAESERLRLECEKSRDVNATLLERYMHLQVENRRLRGGDD